MHQSQSDGKLLKNKGIGLEDQSERGRIRAFQDEYRLSHDGREQISRSRL